METDIIVRKTVEEYYENGSKNEELIKQIEAIGWDKARAERPDLVEKEMSTRLKRHPEAPLESLKELLISQEKMAAVLLLTEMALKESLKNYIDNEFFKFDINVEKMTKDLVYSLLDGMFSPHLSEEAVTSQFLKAEEGNEEIVPEALPERKNWLKRLFA